MQRLKRILIATVAFVLLLLAIGFLLPSAWQVERSVVIRAPVPTIFPYLNSLKQWREWTVWHQQHLDMTTEYSGPDTGVGATSRWSGEDGRGVMKIMQSEHNRLVAYTLLFNGGEFRTDGRLMLMPEGEGTRVVWSAAGEVGRSPVNRYFALFLGFRIGADFADSLALLKQKLETKS
jgi:uncharacterized protein YndB with AHSA1/START domain